MGCLNYRDYETYLLSFLICFSVCLWVVFLGCLTIHLMYKSCFCLPTNFDTDGFVCAECQTVHPKISVNFVFNYVEFLG